MRHPSAPRKFCNLCAEPRVRVAYVWFCNHCDTTIGHTRPCGGCALVKKWKPT